MSTWDDYYGNSFFSEADEHWIPKLIDIEYFKNQTEDEHKAEYFGKFGWDQLVHNTLVLGSDEDIATASAGTALSIEFGNDEDTTYDLVHNFGTFDILFNMRTNASPSMYVSANTFAIDENTIRVVLSSPPGANALIMLLAPIEAQSGNDAYVEINKRWTVLTQRFNQRYANRMIGAETMEVWQNRLQNRFDQVAMRYERAYEIYAKYEQEFLDDVLEGEEETITEENQASGTDSVTGSATNKSWDTPDSAINEDADYANSVGTSNSTGGTTYGRKDVHTISREKIIHGKSILDSANANIRDWVDIDTAFIAEFENLFLNVFWY